MCDILVVVVRIKYKQTSFVGGNNEEVHLLIVRQLLSLTSVSQQAFDQVIAPRLRRSHVSMATTSPSFMCEPLF